MKINAIILQMLLVSISYGQGVNSSQGNLGFGPFKEIVDGYKNYIEVENPEFLKNPKGRTAIVDYYYCDVSTDYKNWKRSDFVTLAQCKAGFRYFNVLLKIADMALELSADRKTFTRRAKQAQNTLWYLMPTGLKVADSYKMLMSVKEETKNVRQVLEMAADQLQKERN